MKKIFKVSLALMISTVSLPVKAMMPTPPPPQVNEEANFNSDDSFRENMKEFQQKYHKLTNEQKKELELLMQEINKKQMDLLKKYVEFGLMSQDDLDSIQKSMEMRISEFNKEEAE